MEKGAATMKRLFLELGGKSAAIVLDDADLAAASMLALRRVHARRAGLRHADPDAAAPVALRRGRRAPQGHLRDASPSAIRSYPTRSADRSSPPSSATASSATSRRASTKAPRSLVGGPDAPAGLDRGFYVTPTLFVDVDNSMTIAREEIFGPVLVVIPYDDDDDAVRIANDSPYGLAGFVLSDSLERSLAVARRLAGRHRSGSTAAPPTAPTCRSVATRPAASAARTASPASTSTSR